MGLARSWLERLQQEWVLPEVIPERCVHSLCEVASCSRCVDACPHGAWLLDDASLQLDTGRCNGCGLCVAACTESALVGQVAVVKAEPAVNRRQFLRQTILFSVEKSLEPQAVLPTRSFVPVLAAAYCNGCDACVQLCPHQALQLDKREDGQAVAYRIQAERCTGCGICEDVCEREAVEVRQMRHVDSEEIPLVQASCKACGSRFHYPADGNAVRQYCQICAHTNHHRQLFQVY